MTEQISKKFCALDINEAVKPLNKCEQAIDDSIFQEKQEANNIQLKYIPMEEPAESTDGIHIFIYLSA